MEQSFEGVPSGAKNIGFGGKENRRTAGQYIKNAFNNVSEKASTAWNGATQKFNEVTQKVRETSRGVVNKIAHGTLFASFFIGAIHADPIYSDEDLYL